MLHLNFQPSRQLTLILFILHLLALCSVLSVSLPMFLHAILSCFILISGLLYWVRDAVRRLPKSIVALSMTPEGCITLQQRNQGTVEGYLLEGSFVAPWLTIMRYKREDARIPCTLLLLPDMLPPELFRQLRVCLKWRRPQTQPLF